MNKGLILSCTALFLASFSLGMFVSKKILTLAYKPNYEISNQEKWQNCIDKSNGSDAKCAECDYLYNYGLGLDLPEEITQATQNDTLIAIVKNNTIFVSFK